MIKKISFLHGIFWLLLVTILLCLPGSEFPKSTWLTKIWIDKWVHIGLFIVIVVSWCWYFYNTSDGKSIKNIFVRVSTVSIIYGIMMELVQELFIPFRGFEFIDILADMAGSITGYFIASRIWLKKNPANSGFEK